jgi:hypothetical protein
MAVSNLSGNRMLSLADFRRYANVLGCSSDRAYSGKSAASTNASAASSLLRGGSCFAITVALVVVHGSGTEGPRISRAPGDAIRECHTSPAHGIPRANGKIACLLTRMRRSRGEAGIAREHRFDMIHRDPCCAFRLTMFIPIKEKVWHTQSYTQCPHRGQYLLSLDDVRFGDNYLFSNGLVCGKRWRQNTPRFLGALRRDTHWREYDATRTIFIPTPTLSTDRTPP